MNTFHGPDDWDHTKDQAVLNSIWNSPKSLNKPFILAPPAINDLNPNAIIYFVSATLIWEKLSLEESWLFIYLSTCDYIFPNLDDDSSEVKH